MQGIVGLESDGAWTHTLPSWDSVLYFLNGRGGGQSEHERGREGGKEGERKGRTLQPAHRRTGVPSLWIRV